MFGFVAGGSPHPTRWGDGSDGDATWSGTTTQTGIKQYKTLTIADSSVIKVGSVDLLQNGLVVFANREIIIGNSVEINAQPNSNTYRESTSWTSSGGDRISDAYGWNGGGGGGAYGTNCTGDGTQHTGNDPAFYYTTGNGTSYGSLIADAGSAAAAGVNRSNTSGGNGASGASAQSSWITNNFGFTLATVSGHDDFPVVHGGDGGQGGSGSTCDEYQTPGSGGTGGGMILLIAPKITFGTGVELNAYGNRFGEGNDGTYTTSNSGGNALQNLNGKGLGDGGSGGGGAGGGGLVAVVYDTKTGSYTADAASGYGGVGKTNDGNKGGNGGSGGAGVTLEGQRGYMAGSITWS
jgi:hypothetical protein